MSDDRDTFPEDRKTEAPEPAGYVVEMRDVHKDFQIYPTPGKKLLELLLGGRFRFHDVKKALAGVSFQAGRGTATGLIGQNGSGKSTILRLLAGIMQPTSGEVIVRGRTCAMLDLQSGLNMEFSGRENIYNRCALLGMSRSQTDKHFDSIVGFSGLGNRIEHPVKTYSQGMLLRLGFSIIVHADFDVLLIDEVMFVGDEVFSRQCKSMLQQLKYSRGKTIVVSSHSMGQLADFCENLLYLDEGVPVMFGRTESVIEQYMLACDSRFSRTENPLCAQERRQFSAESIGKIRMGDVEFLDANGAQVDELYCNDPLRIRVHYEVDEPVDNPCFRVMFFNNSGLFLHGTNSYRQGLDLGRMTGSGAVELEYPCFRLLEGDYYVSVGIWPDEYQSFVTREAYDAREFGYVLRVNSRRNEGGGFFHIPNSWKPK